MVAINSALAVDLTGQVAADTLMGRFFSGIGGQVDFIRGAARSRGGRPIIALRSTAKEGTVSRIRPALEEGAGVVTSRGDVHYVVTEYGVADLWGKSIRERALSLIEIAHPDHRAELLSAAKARHYVFPDQIAPRAANIESRIEHLSSGDDILLRPLKLSDESALQDMLYRLSDESTYRRFMAYKKVHPHEEIQKLVDVDYKQSMGIIACAGQDHAQIIGMARYDVDAATGLGDIAFVVRDEWHGRGVGTSLLRRMIELAKAEGLPGFEARILAENKPMLRLFKKSGLPIALERKGDIYHLTTRFEDAVVPSGKGI